MAETIYTIPINNAFDQGTGCPFCRLHRQLEAEVTAYISGPAMMESDVRRETNRLGFCRRHHDHLLAAGNRLSLALMQESRLAELEAAMTPAPARRGLFSGGSQPDLTERLAPLTGSCYVCQRTETFFSRALDNTVHLWKTDSTFEQKFAAREDYCLPHVTQLLQTAQAGLGAGQFRAFADQLQTACTRQIQTLSGQVKGFAASFDYRNAGKALTEEEKRAIEDAGDFLCGL